MTRDKAFQIVKNAIVDYGYDEETVTDISLSSTIADLDLDSLELVELSIAIEELLNIDFDIPVLSAMLTVEDLVKLVEVYE